MGPTASIPLREPLTDQQVEDLDAWLKHNALNLKGEPGDWGPFWIRDTSPFLPPLDDARDLCAFWVQLTEPEYYEEGELEQVVACLGYAPKQSLLLLAGCSGAVNHRILGNLALVLAGRLSSVVDLGGALAPYVSPERRQKDAITYHYPWCNLDDISAYVRAMPGQVRDIEYQTARGTSAVYHIVDLAFLRSWLAHPGFHMIK